MKKHRIKSGEIAAAARRRRVAEFKQERTGYDNDTHHLLQIKRVNESLTMLRAELALSHNADICEHARKETTFEGSIATIAERLDIILDGLYDPDKLFTMLTEALRNRGKHQNLPHLRAGGLVNAEIVETEGEVTLKEIKDEVEEEVKPSLILPPE